MVSQNLLKLFSKFAQHGELVGITVLVVLSRIMPHPPNVAPVTALALYSGSRVGKGRAAFLPLIAMFLSDVVIGFHNTMAYVYGSFLLITLFGVLLRKNQKWGNLMVMCSLSSLLFFLITNFGVWIAGTMYPHTVGGLLSAYEMGIPFLRNTFIGDMVYANLFFYGFQFIGFFARRLAPANLLRTNN